MHVIDIIFFVCVALLANYYSLRGILPIKRIVANTAIGVIYFFIIAWLVGGFQKDNILPNRELTEVEAFKNLIWYNMAKPTGVGIIIYSLPLLWLQYQVRKKSNQWVQLGFQNKLTNIFGCAWVSLLQCSIALGILYFFYVFTFYPAPITLKDSKLASYLAYIEEPLHKANKYDYWMYGYMSRDKWLPDDIKLEIKQLVYKLNEEEAAIELAYWVGDKLKYDPTSINALQPLFPGFNLPISKILNDGKGVSLEYARLYHAAINVAGLNGAIVVGKAKIGGNLVEHCWNEVEVYGEWLAIDPTWSNAGKELVVTLKEELEISGRLAVNDPEARALINPSIYAMLPEGAEIRLVRGKLWFGNLDKDKYIPYAKYSFKK